MTDTAATNAPHPMQSVLSTLGTLVTLVGNLIPLYGVLYWQWDTFQLLMLYWTETVIVAFWTLRRLATLPEDQLGTITVNGQVQKATTFSMVGFFSLHSGIFILVHFFFLWVLFSGAWLKKVHGIGSFFSELLLVNGVWMALLFFFIGCWVSFLLDRKPAYARQLERKIYPSRPIDSPEKQSGDAVGGVIGQLYIRIVIMQVAIIGGAWFAQKMGSMAPLLFVIGLKTMVDLSLGSHVPAAKDVTFSSGNISIKS